MPPAATRRVRVHLNDLSPGDVICIRGVFAPYIGHTRSGATDDGQPVYRVHTTARSVATTTPTVLRRPRTPARVPA